LYATITKGIDSSKFMDRSMDKAAKRRPETVAMQVLLAPCLEVAGGEHI
jgi:hypothetical protein